MMPDNVPRPALCRLVCPDCHSESLKIKHLKGWERVMVLLSDKRKYFCKECGLGFRARDRRRIPRAENALDSPWAAAIFRGD
jgi:uncharacterized protein YbaR (Trm112 family)